jgi:DNA-binding NarL/FixJ family response regulator
MLMPGSTPLRPPPAANPRIRVVLADDHRIVRDGLRSLLGHETDMDVVGMASDGLEAVRLARELQPDVLVTDVAMPGLNGLEAIRRIHSEQPAVRLLCLSMHDDSRMVLAVLNAGASGYVLKDSSSEELATAIRKVVARKVYVSPDLMDVVVDGLRQQQDSAQSKPNGQPAGADNRPDEALTPLTPRERELVQLLSEGYSSNDVAERMHVSIKTVATHREHVMRKLRVGSVAELTRYALREGLSSLNTPCAAARGLSRSRTD